MKKHDVQHISGNQKLVEKNATSVVFILWAVKQQTMCNSQTGRHKQVTSARTAKLTAQHTMRKTNQGAHTRSATCSQIISDLC